MMSKQTYKQILAMVRRMESIRYQNPNGGEYAYLQFMAFSRELRQLLSADEESSVLLPDADRLDAVAWLFNEYLGVRFTNAQEVIFENRMRDIAPVLKRIAGHVHSRMLTQVSEQSQAYTVLAA